MRKENGLPNIGDIKMSEYIMDKICSGCLTYERSLEIKNSNRFFTCGGYKTKDIDCPCQHCLIKTMCIIACEKLTERPWHGLSLTKELF